MAKNTSLYCNKTILAPMVRIGTLPTRLLCLRYGADLVYSPEIVDHTLLNTTRMENSVHNTIDYVEASGSNRCVFRTCAEERGRVILQLGTADAERAVAVLRHVQADIAGIDVNMGCPKAFSLQGGMGAALLKRPDKVNDILTSLVAASTVPVTAKIRVLDSLEDTLELCRLIERTGVSALAVHGRTVKERPRHVNRYEVIREITRAVNIPVIANGASGEIKSFEDIDNVRRKTGASSIMIARAAEHDPSIFRAQGHLALGEIMTDYVKLCVDLGNNPVNAKYVLQQMLQDQQTNTERGRAVLASATLQDICVCFDLAEYYDSNYKSSPSLSTYMQMKTSDCAMKDERKEDKTVLKRPYEFLRKHYRHQSPKQILNEHARRLELTSPTYSTVQRSNDKRFLARARFCDREYVSTIWNRNRKFAEQSAALVALSVLENGLLLEQLPLPAQRYMKSVMV